MVPGFDIEESHLVINRKNGWLSFLVALAFIRFSFLFEITSAYSHHDIGVLSTEKGNGRTDVSRVYVSNRNNSPGDAISSSSSSSSQTRPGKEDSKSMTGTNTRVRSNQHGLIAVSILVEIEERTVIPILLSPNENRDRCSEKNKRTEFPLISNEHNLSIASLRNGNDVNWTVTVEEIQVGGSELEKEGPNQTPSPYSQLVHLEWKKTEEGNEYITGSSYDTDIKNGSTIPNTGVPNRLWQSLIHHSGTANCTFLIPLELDDSYMLPSLSTRAFLVSLTQTTRLAAPMMTDSLHADGRHNNDNFNDRETTTSVLTRRLATLPRKSNSHIQSTIDPVVDVFLHHIQQQTYRETPDRLSEDISSGLRKERQSTHDDGDDRSGYPSKKNLEDVFEGESNFLWTILLLCTLHVMQSLPVGYIMRFAFCFERTKRLGHSIHAVHSQDYNENNYEENADHDYRAKENIDIETEYHCCQENHFRSNQCFKEGKERESEIQSISFQSAQPSSEKNSKKISVETNTCVDDDSRHNDHIETINNHDGYSITVNYGDSDDNSNYIETGHEEGDSKGKSLDRSGDNSLIVHEEVPPDDNTTRVPSAARLTAINSDICLLSDNDLEPSNPKLGSEGASFDSSQKIAFISTTDDRNNYAKAITASTMESSSSNDHIIQVPPNLTKSREMENASNNKVLEKSFNKLQFKTNFDSPLKDSPKEIICVAHSSNQGEDLDRSSREEPPKKIYEFGTFSCKIQSDDSMQPLSKAMHKEIGCKYSQQQLYKHPSKDSFKEILDETSDAKENLPSPPEFPSQLMKTVNSVDSSNKCRPLKDRVIDDHLLTNERPEMNLFSTVNGPLQKLSITPPRDVGRQVNQEIRDEDVVDQTLDINGLKKGRNESYNQKEKSPQLTRDRTNSVERKASTQATLGHHFDMDIKEMKRKDQIENIANEGARLCGNDTELFFDKIDDVNYDLHCSQSSMEGPSRRRQERNATESVSSKSDSSSPLPLPLRGQEILTQFSNLEEQKIYEARLGQTDRDSPNKSDLKFDGSPQRSQTRSASNQHHNSLITRENNLKQIHLFSNCKKSQLHQKLEICSDNSGWKRNECQNSEADESYVSTLPPDSDYVSDDDPFLLLSGSSRSESQDLKSQVNKRKQKKNSTETRSRKKRTISRNNGLPDEEAITRCTTSTVMKSEKLPNNSKETDLDPLEVVRVELPDSYKKRSKRPYSKSNYVADWVPSNELQSISQEFLQEDAWDIVVQTIQSCDTKELRSI